MAKRKENNYFEMLSDIADNAITASEMLKKTLENYNPDTMEATLVELHDIEHGADLKKHNLINNLIKEFITQIDREDIAAISRDLDDVIDYMEELFQKLYMFNIREIRPEAHEFANIIIQLSKAVKNVFEEFHNFKHPENTYKLIIEVNNLEEEADRLYMKSIRNLHTTETNAVLVHAWTILFDKFEKVCDQCEHVVDTIESVIMKNL